MGPWARGATRPASWPAVAARPAMRVAAPPRWPRSCWRPTASDPKTVGVRGHASGRRRHRAATEERIITIIFQNRCWVSGPGVEFTGKGGEEPLSGEEGRAPPLESPAVRRPSAGPTWRDCGGIEAQVSPGRGGPNDGWLTSTANSGSGPASLVRRLASISLRPALRIPERNNDLRRGPDLLSNEKSWCTPNVRKEGHTCRAR